MRLRYLPVLLAVCVLFANAEEQEAKSPKEYARTFAEMLKAFDKPTVKIYRIDPKESAPKEGEKSIGGYLVLEEKAFAQEDVVKLKEALTNEEMYSNGFAACFEPGLAFWIKQEDKILELIVCLRCRYVRYWDGKARKTWPLSEKSQEAMKKIYARYFSQGEKGP